jgi:N-sulfoglucosamine sulfohydrolase
VCEDMSPHLSCFGESTIQTPHLDALAKDGILYTNAYTVAGVCAPSRNGIITSLYPISIGGNNMRNYHPGKQNDNLAQNPLPSYSIIPPAYVKCFSEYLRREKYYCTNNPKEDYQFEAPVTAWDESSNTAHYKNRPDSMPFFAVFNLSTTHESQIWARNSEPLLVDPTKVLVPPYYPDILEVRQDIARHLSNVIQMDKQAGIIIQQLKNEGLYNNTIIFFYSDHGDGLPFVKREITKRGLHIPLIIKLPQQIKAGTTDNQLISAIDFGPTVLSLAGIPIPNYMMGKAFLGSQQSKEGRKYIYAARDRMDSAVDRVRAVYDGRYEYIRNYMPEKSYYQNIAYRLKIPLLRRMLELRDSGKLNTQQMQWFSKAKPVEELYDTENDPNQFNNLANNIAYQKKFKELKKEFDRWIKEIGDLHALPELEFKDKIWNHQPNAPVTEKPILQKLPNGYGIRCATTGASIGYKQKKQGETGFPNTWQVYHNQPINLSKGDQIVMRAQRIGFTATQQTVSIR